MSRLIYVIAFTPSFERMRQFYENSLDLKVKGEKKNWVEYDTGGARFALHSIGPEKRGIQLRFEAKNIERECADMTKRGVRFEHEVESWLAPTRAFQPGGGMKLGTVILNAEEFGRAATFYRDHVGLPVVADRDHWIEFDTGDTRTALHFRGNGDDAPLHASPKISFAFEVKDLDEHARRLRERGVHFASAPREEEFGVFAELLDPDGNVVVIREPVPMPSLEEELAEPFEDDTESPRASMRRPVRKDAKATSRVALRPDYKTRGAKAQPVGTKKKSSKGTKPRTARGAGPERTRVEPKSKRDPKRARNRPATGRQKKAERKTFAEKKRAVAGASKSKPVKRAARPAKKK